MKLPIPKEDEEIKMFWACLWSQLKKIQHDYEIPNYDQEFTGGLHLLYRAREHEQLQACRDISDFIKTFTDVHREFVNEKRMVNRMQAQGACRLTCNAFAHYYSIKYAQLNRPPGQVPKS